VAYRALQDLWGADRLRRATAEPLWASYNPESAFVDSLQSRWTLSLSRPLVTWLRDEPEKGPLVKLAERLESGRAEASARGEEGPAAQTGELAASDFGLDLGQTAEGRLFIAFLDPGSPADAAGLRSGDVVLTLEGRSFVSVADAMRAAHAAWEQNREVNLSVDRQGKEVFFQIHG
jgi:S1-C subfamily serine protease